MLAQRNGDELVARLRVWQLEPEQQLAVMVANNRLAAGGCNNGPSAAAKASGAAASGACRMPGLAMTQATKATLTIA